jgi:hypothetical protein
VFISKLRKEHKPERNELARTYKKVATFGGETPTYLEPSQAPIEMLSAGQSRLFEGANQALMRVLDDNDSSLVCANEIAAAKIRFRDQCSFKAQRIS